ncbi:MAG: hypothetical protein ACTSPB_11900 [Candidatus Thorarchaeota archaeon]
MPVGMPRTDAERMARHQRLYGTSELPPRGTGFGSGYLLDLPAPLPPVDIAHLIHIGVMTVVGLVVGVLIGQAQKQ